MSNLRAATFKGSWQAVVTGSPVLLVRGLMLHNGGPAQKPDLAREENSVYIMYKHGITAMKARVQKWGNSLGIRIPKVLAQEVALETDSEVDLSTQDGTIIISPITQKTASLRQLLSKITEANLHGEIATGKVEGREAW
jgi:antitoxin MazE